jgi:hypothetical protein
MSATEKEIFAAAEPEMLRCRPGDWGHAQRVAKWVRQLGEGRDDLQLLLTAALIHDIGWRDVVPSSQKITFDELLEHEPQANQNSEPFVTEFLRRFQFSQPEIDKVLRLVKAADDHYSNAGDEAVIVDADNLSKLNIAHLREKYQPSQWMRMYDHWAEEYPSRITTSKGQEEYAPLLDKLRADIIREQEKN